MQRPAYGLPHKRKMPMLSHRHSEEARTGFEPVITVLQTIALPLGYHAMRADYGARTRYLHLGKVALYQMS